MNLNGTISSNYKYSSQGQEKQQETGWSDFGGRMYMPDAGRWLSADPLSEDFGDWSPYNYVFNNPVRYIDPDGNAPIDVVGEGESCCQHMKGFALTMVDNVIGSNLRNKYGSKTQEYRDGVNNGHGASMVLAALIATDGVTSIGGGTGGLAVSGAASSTGVGAIAGGPGAAVSSGLILKGTLEVAGAAVITKNVMDNMKSDKKEKSSELNTAKRGSFRKPVVKQTWEDAKDGSKEDTKQCPTCKKDVEGNPHKNQKRSGKNGWDMSHNPSWSRRNLKGKTRKEQLDNYNTGVELECKSCNRSAGNNDSRFQNR